MLTPAIIDAAYTLVHQLRAQSSSVTTIESCTGGQVGAAITAISGSSAVYPGGVITYSDALKHQLVEVEQATINGHGAVSEQTAQEMAQGGRSAFCADYAIAITGIAGPSGGTNEKPVGTVWICVAGQNALDCRRFVFPGNRSSVRSGAVYAALSMTNQHLSGKLSELSHEHERIAG
jgi:nicotinamide-nucleotide amidase